MAKRKALKKKTTPRRSTKNVPSKPTRAEPAKRKKNAVPSSVEDWLISIRDSHAGAEAAAKPRGACLVGDPAGGPSMCFFVDRDTCKLMKGTFVGGPC